VPTDNAIAIENQAFDRAHRFGQREDVKIYKLAIEDTIEDKLLALQEKKQEVRHILRLGTVPDSLRRRSRLLWVRTVPSRSSTSSTRRTS
jgi:SNF2 family DNA or RNA helicase